MASASTSSSSSAAAPAVDIESEVANVLHVLSVQSSPLKESPEALAAATKVGRLQTHAHTPHPTHNIDSLNKPTTLTYL